MQVLLIANFLRVVLFMWAKFFTDNLLICRPGQYFQLYDLHLFALCDSIFAQFDAILNL